MRGVNHVLGLASRLVMLMDRPASFTVLGSRVAMFVFGDPLMVVFFGSCRGRIRR